jgi:hypothetical protein
VNELKDSALGRGLIRTEAIEHVSHGVNEKNWRIVTLDLLIKKM